MAKKKSSNRKSKPRVQAPAAARSVRRGFDRRLVGAIAAAAVLIVGVLVAVSVLSNRSDSSANSSGGAPAADGTRLPGAGEVQRLLEGIPQSRETLGRPDAPVTVIEYADPQCPFCANFAVRAFPDLVRRYIRPGKVKIVFHGVAIIGPDSFRGVHAAFAAGQQDKLWNLVEVMYLNQGPENSGWLDDDFLRSAGGSVSGLDVEQMLAASGSAAAEQRRLDVVDAARQAGVKGTPTFQVGKTGGALSQGFIVDSGTIAGLAERIDPLLGQ